MTLSISKPTFQTRQMLEELHHMLTYMRPAGAKTEELFVKTFVDNLPGVMADGFDAELDELRAIQTNCDGFLLELEGREPARTGIANLRVQFNKVHGFYIEVTGSHLDKVPMDYQRRQTLKNAERYITPELKAFEDKALSAQERALARENFKRIGESFACAAKTAGMDAEAIRRVLECGGTEKLPPAQDGVRPSVVIAVGHFGNFELYARTNLFVPGYQMATTYRGLRQPGLNALMQSLRAKSGALYFERRRDAAHQRLAEIGDAKAPHGVVSRECFCLSPKHATAPHGRRWPAQLTPRCGIRPWSAPPAPRSARCRRS